MKNKFLIMYVIAGVIFLWVVANFNNFLNFMQAKTVIQNGFLNSSSENVQTALNYEKHLSSIRIRGCTFGAKLISIECLCPELLQKLSLGDYWQEFENNYWEEQRKIEERRVQSILSKTSKNIQNIINNQ